MTKVSKHMSDLIPTLTGLKGKYWGYYPSKVETANTQGTDWNEKATVALRGIGYTFGFVTSPKKIFDHIVTKAYYIKTDDDGISVVELTQYNDSGYTWAHVCVSGDAAHGIEVWKALYGEDVYGRAGVEHDREEIVEMIALSL